ncbi:hypothetical protein PHYSODRAFT_434778, partial [Phytophthora sojae]
AGSLFQVRSSTPELSHQRILLVTIGGTAALVLLATMWVFPVPFTILLNSFLASAVFVVLFVVSVKKNASTIDQIVEGSLKQKLYLIIAQVLIATIYIVFSLVFTNCASQQRFELLLALPVIKLSLKHVVVRLVQANEESIPAVIAFTVDVFNGLYSSICIQSSGSWLASLVIIIVNFGFTVL